MVGGEIVALDHADADFQPQGFRPAPQIIGAGRRIEAAGIGNDANAPVQQGLEMGQDVALGKVVGEALAHAGSHSLAKPAHHGLGEKIEHDVVERIAQDKDNARLHNAYRPVQLSGVAMATGLFTGTQTAGSGQTTRQQSGRDRSGG